MDGGSLELVGAPGSPYSRKMRALMRYRRIPFVWKIPGARDTRDVPEVPVPLIPVLVFREGAGAGDSAMVDSTLQIRRLEELWPARSVIPPDPVMAFLDALLEDYADEWLTKAMFHYRWAHPADADQASRVLPRWSRTELPDARIAELSSAFRERQVGRLGVVGSNADTATLIEESYERLVRALDAHLAVQPFVMGGRPGSSDFGLFGQLTQLVLFDPTPARLTLEVAPRLVAWCEVVEDLSGHEPRADDWTGRDAVPATLQALLHEVGRVYAPFLLANAAALEAGAARVECEIDGRKWLQKPFPYQGKCLARLRERHARLAANDREALDARLHGTGCAGLFQ